jgi:hypothetical protein
VCVCVCVCSNRASSSRTTRQDRTWQASRRPICHPQHRRCSTVHRHPGNCTPHRLNNQRVHPPTHALGCSHTPRLFCTLLDTFLGNVGRGSGRGQCPPLEELGHAQAIACIVAQPLANFNISANERATSPRASCIAHLNTTQPTRLRCGYIYTSVSTAYSVASRLALPAARELALRSLSLSCPTRNEGCCGGDVGSTHPNFVNADRHGVAVVRRPLQQ